MRLEQDSALRYPEILQSTIRNFYIGKIKCDTRVNTFQKVKEKATDRSDWRIAVANKLSGRKIT